MDLVSTQLHHGDESKEKQPKKQPQEYQLPMLPEAGEVFTSGRGLHGELGDGAFSKKFFTSVDGMSNNIVFVAAGDWHTICLSNKGEVWTFGCNSNGALGRPANNQQSFVPGKVPLNGRAAQITAGFSHSSALMEDGRVYFWGMFLDRHGGMLAKDELIENCKIPRLMQIPGRVIRLVSGGNHMLFLTQTGRVYSAGSPDNGQLGRLSERSATRNTRSGLKKLLKPQIVRIRGCTHFVDIWATQYGSFVKDRKKGIFVFGSNRFGQLATGMADPVPIYHPIKSLPLSENSENWVKIVGGHHHTLFLNKAGQVYVVGRYDYGRLGLGENEENAAQPTLVAALSDKKVVDIGCGTVVSYAIIDNGDAYAWGLGFSGQLGSGELSDIWVPEKIKDDFLKRKRVMYIDAGDQHGVLLAFKRHKLNT